MVTQTYQHPINHFFKRLLVIICLIAGCLAVPPKAQPQTGSKPANPDPQRIVSMSPATTEILFALGLGDRVVGVTRYCDYPAETTTITKVGGYMDPNYEMIMTLAPDLVILLTSHDNARIAFKKLGIVTLTTEHRTITDIHQSIRLIGDTCGAGDRADAILEDLEQRTRALQQHPSGGRQPRVLICIERDTKSGRLTSMFMAGRNDFYDEIIVLAGGINAYRGTTIAFPQLSAEGVIHLNPDVIIDLVSPFKPGDTPPEKIRQQWNRLSMITAVRRKQVYTIVGYHALRPGPRYILFLAELAALLRASSAAGVNNG